MEKNKELFTRNELDPEERVKILKEIQANNMKILELNRQNQKLANKL
jgi:hypothetical protein